MAQRDQSTPLQTSESETTKEPDAVAASVTTGADATDHTESSQTSHFQAWSWEISSLCCGLVFLLLNVVILSIINGQPLKPWILFGHSISPNTLISIFSTLSKTSITLPLAEGLSQLKWTYFRQRSHPVVHMQLFDEASRGPWGALKLVWRLNVRAFVAAFGAMTVAPTLAMDPFSQQLLSYPTRQVIDNGTSAVSIAATHELPNMTSTGNLTNAMYLGMYDSGTQDVAFNCSTGHCTWPGFTTLAVCSSCMDRTSELRFDFESWNDTERDGYGINSTYTTPSGVTFRAEFFDVSLGAHDLWTDTMFQTNVQLFENYDLIGLSWGDDGDFALPSASEYSVGTAGEIARIMHLRFAGQTDEDYIEPWQDPAVDSIQVTPWTLDRRMADYHECTLSYCLQIHNESAFQSGRLNDRATATSAINFDKSHSIDGEDSVVFAGTTSPQGLSGINLTQAYLDRHPGIYWINDRTNQAFLDQINKIFNFSYGGTSMTENRGIIMYGPKMVERVAASLTTHLRSETAMTAVEGHAASDKTFVHVIWPWLILPAILVFCAALFLIFCVLFSAQEDALVWKSSPLALLFHGLHGWEERELKYSRLRSMEEKARGMEARLESDEKGNIRLLRR